MCNEWINIKPIYMVSAPLFAKMKEMAQPVSSKAFL